MSKIKYLDYIRKWRLWVRPVVIACYIVFLITIIPIVVINALKNGFTKYSQALVIGGFFVMIALPLSIWEIVQHMVHYNQPHLQKHIIRILWIVPIFAVNAWLELAFYSSGMYLDAIRECYEAFVIYNFMAYLLNYLNSETDLIHNLEQKPQIPHFFPLRRLPPWKMGQELVDRCKHGTLQYTVVRSITSIISVICQLNGVYGDGQFKSNVAYPYIAVVNSLSQMLAMYCLTLFYRANREDLGPIKPLAKFLCIKALIFFTMFQSFIISLLVSTGVISSDFLGEEGEDAHVIGGRIQDYLICLEVFVAAICHRYCFSHKPFVLKTEVKISDGRMTPEA